MKWVKPALLFISIALTLLILYSFNGERGLVSLRDGDLDEIDDESPEIARLRAEFYLQQRAFPNGEIPRDWRIKAIRQVEENRARQHNAHGNLAPMGLEALRPIGPAPITNGRTFVSKQNLAGRVTSLATDPQDPTTVYLGAAQGGVWRSLDGGNFWQPLTDNAPTQATGAIAVDPTNPNIIYIGTGEGNDSLDSFFGMGILKSTDRGQTWTNFAAPTFAGQSFSKLVVDPKNPQTLYGALSFGFAGVSGVFNPRPARAGIYRSTDGGMNWTNMLMASSGNFSFDAFDIEIAANDSATLYAAFFGQGIFKSTDAGKNWQKLAGGLPTTNFGRPDIAVSKSNPAVIYAAFEDRRTIDLLNIYRSTDGGASWRTVAQPPRTAFGNICQCFYDNFIEVDPTDADTVYFGGVGFYKSVNGGQSWINLSAGSIGMHEDYHAMAFVPGNPAQFYVGNDGGVWFSADGGNTLINRNTNLNISQFESIAQHPTDAAIAIGGTQDNGTNMLTGESWQQVDVRDGGFAAFDQTNPNIVYHTYQNVRNSFVGPVRSTEGGISGSWRIANNGIDRSDNVLFYAPFILDPADQSTLYFGTDRLYRTTDQGTNWRAISQQLITRQGAVLSAIGAGAPFIYTGATDGSVFASNNRGETFRNVTDNLPQRYISDFVVDPVEPATVYLSLSGFLAGHVFVSRSGGGNWEDISGNLPDLPANALAINPRDSRNLFVGTDLGLFVTVDGGKDWQLMPGLPMVSVFDIALNSSLGLLRIATHGRGIYEMRMTVEDAVAPTVKVMMPNGGEKLRGEITISWQSSDNIAISSHDVLLSIDGGVSFPITVATGLAGDIQTVQFQLPDQKIKKAVIKVIARDRSGNLGSDSSDRTFKIKPG